MNRKVGLRMRREPVVGEGESFDFRRRLSLGALKSEVDWRSTFGDHAGRHDRGQCQSNDQTDGDGKPDALSALALAATRARGP
jgi:hypothetical protein